MPRLNAALAAALLAVAVLPLRAQQPGGQGGLSRAERKAVPHNQLSVGMAAGRGTGALHDAVGDGWGASVRSLRRLDAGGSLWLRVEGGLLQHGRRAEPIPGTEHGEVFAANTMAFAGIGPQVQARRGPVRPYAHGFAGVHYLYSRYGTRGTSRGGPSVEVSAVEDDGSWAWGGGAGVYVALRRRVLLDAGATWREGGPGEYLVLGPGRVRGPTDQRVVHLALTLAF